MSSAARMICRKQNRLHAFGSARTLDCCALPAATCECWPAEPQLTPHPPVVRVCTCVRACARVMCLSACVCACVCLRACVRVCVYTFTSSLRHIPRNQTTTTVCLQPRQGRNALKGSFPPIWVTFPGHLTERAATLTLFVFVIAATCTMLQQDLAPHLLPTQHPCMPLHFNAIFFPTTPLHLNAISVLANNCLSGMYRWTSPHVRKRQSYPPHPHKPLH